MTENIRLPLTSADAVAERLESLKALAPEAFAEGKVDCEKLKTLLGGGERGRSRTLRPQLGRQA